MSCCATNKDTTNCTSTAKYADGPLLYCLVHAPEKIKANPEKYLTQKKVSKTEEHEKIIEFRNDDLNGPYACFSNLYVCPIKNDQIFDNEGNPIMFNCVEQAYLFQKYYKNKPPAEIARNALKTALNKILLTKTGAEVIKLEKDLQPSFRGKEARGPAPRSDWELPSKGGNMLLRYHFLFEIMLRKFTQNKDIAKILLSTSDYEIRETGHDIYLGNKGENLMGLFLMGIRKTLKASNS